MARPEPHILAAAIDPDDPQLVDQSQWLLASDSLDASKQGRSLLASYGLQLRARSVYPSLGLVVSRFVLSSRVSTEPGNLLPQIRKDHPGLMLEFNRHYVPLQSAQELLHGRLEAAGQQRETYGWVLTGATDNECLGRAAGRHIGMLDGAVNGRLDTIKGGSVITRDMTGLKPPPTNHATAIASLLLGTHALTPGAQLHAMTIFAEDDRQRYLSNTEWVLKGLDYLLSLRPLPDVINLSFGGPPSALLSRAFESSARTTLLVAAAGNSGPDRPPAFPARLDDIIAVTAIGPGGSIYSGANQGAGIDLAAPGVDLLSTGARGQATFVTGTSFAAPWVSAAAVLVRAGTGITRPELLRKELLSKALDLGVPGHDNLFGWGLVDLTALCKKR
jgi:hypothetical protein